MKATRIATLLVACFAGLFLNGCKSTWDFWKHDAANTVQSNIRHFDQINRSIHLHLLNTDWNDPYNEYIE
jgi:hypothetical protein